MHKTIKNVKRAMLSMQRASWKQRVAAQALLELGDREFVVLMAKESVLRQDADGRLNVLYTDQGVTDPAAAGEAVFTAAEWSGDQQLIDASQKYVVQTGLRLIGIVQGGKWKEHRARYQPINRLRKHRARWHPIRHRRRSRR